MIDHVLVLPTPRALLPPYSVEDPVAELRTAARDAVDGLLREDPERLFVVAPDLDPANRARGISEPLGHRVARHLLAGRGPTPEEWVAGPGVAEALRVVSAPAALLVTADGSASRGEKAPGHLHPEAVPFDDSVERALRSGDAAALAGLDPRLAQEVWCDGVAAFHVLAGVVQGRTVRAEVTYADAPYGVAWWVARWELSGEVPDLTR